tara:strand:- start:663 stop:1937 length:1275 start_codon:yes stop_codon:yes gene_type:complete
MELGTSISVVIPTLDNPEAVKKVINSLNNQTLLPKEILICDSSSKKEIEGLVKTIESTIEIKYFRVGKAFPFDRILISFSKVFSKRRMLNSKDKGRAFPYEATNLGSEEATGEFLAFLDATTIPEQDWLKDYLLIYQEKKVKVVFGKTKYLALSSFQKLLRTSTYGRRGHETIPGTLIRKEDFILSGQIINGVRSGGDIEWRNRVKSMFSFNLPKKSYLSYSDLPKDLIIASKKIFIYQLHGSRLDIQNTVKDIYLGLALIFSAILIPKWNSFVGWKTSPLYMPNITKLYLLGLVVIFLTTLIINRGALKKLSNSFFSNTLKLLIFIFVFLGVFRWNGAIAGWVESSVWYIPHMTKIFIGAVLLSSVAYRGLYFPLKNEVEKEYLFPFKWLQVGLLGLFLDCVKAPGYLIGSILSPFSKKIKKD